MLRKLFSLGAIAAVLLGLTGCAARYTVSGGTEFNLGDSGEEEPTPEPEETYRAPEPKQDNPQPKTQPPKPDEESHQHYDLLSPETPYVGEGNTVDGRFSDDFSGYDTGVYAQGQDFGPWTIPYNGDGIIQITAYHDGAWLELEPALPDVPQTKAELEDKIRESMPEEESRALTSERLQELMEREVTRSALVVGPNVSAPFVYRAVVVTDSQTKENPAEEFETHDEAMLELLEPNPWEAAWVIWNYMPAYDGDFNKDSFHYFILKPNGWELGYRDSLGQQHDLATGDSVKLCTDDQVDCKGPDFREPYEIVVEHDFFKAITVYVDGEKVVYHKDEGVQFGRIGMYTEDAAIGVSNVEVVECEDDDPLCEEAIQEVLPID